MKTCHKCKKQLPQEKFGKNSNRPDGLQTACKACKKKLNRDWYLNNKQRRKELNKRYQKKLQEFYIKARSKPCADCGKQYHWVVMEFDHTGNDKFMNVSLMKKNGYPIERLKEEINKCDLVCSNCHQIRSYIRHHGELPPMKNIS